METNDRISSGVTVIGAEGPSESPNQFLGSSLAPMEAPMASAGAGEASGKKKRGRPRKNEANGDLLPLQISSSAPLVKKRGRDKFNGLDVKMHNKRMGFHTCGERFGVGVGSNFTPHIITVNAGEDITMRLISFSQQGPRAICILSANGVISNVTFRQPNSCGGTLTYEGYVKVGIKSHIMIVGDGIGKTIITGHKSKGRGFFTFKSATFVAEGDGLGARDMTIRNTAGPENKQATALRSDSDKSVYIRCSIQGYQDTLYVHSWYQFFRECNIYSTVNLYSEKQSLSSRTAVYWPVALRTESTP